jgi:hypothetical protein
MLLLVLAAISLDWHSLVDVETLFKLFSLPMQKKKKVSAKSCKSQEKVFGFIFFLLVLEHHISASHQKRVA